MDIKGLKRGKAEKTEMKKIGENLKEERGHSSWKKEHQRAHDLSGKRTYKCKRDSDIQESKGPIYISNHNLPLK